MGGVPQYTTPTFTLTFTEQELNLTQAQKVFVTFKSGEYELTKTGGDLNVGEKTIDVYLQQNETGSFRTGNVKIQANWVTSNGDRVASEIVTYNITDQLLKGVIS